MNDWFNQYIRTNTAVPQPPFPTNTTPAPTIPPETSQIRSNKPHVFGFCQLGAYLTLFGQLPEVL